VINSTAINQVDLAPLWKALADSKRRRIIQLLSEKTLTTSEITAFFDVSRFAVMRHLKVLEQAGLIRTRREGRQRWNFLNEALFQQIQHVYLDDSPGEEYQLGDVLSFLSRQEGGREKEVSALESPPIQQEISLRATPERVFQAITDEVDAWWSYRISPDSHIYLEPQAGGRFYEAFKPDGEALYALVTYLKPGEEIRLNGSMGFDDQATNNIIQITLQPQQPGAVRLQLTHRLLGRASAITIDTFKRSWEELLTLHLKSFVEQGKRYRPQPDDSP
jgi:DNA-binding transcriptional ArsR family regulator/uncharacterized protein YndB with AHSA1/START domain